MQPSAGPDEQLTRWEIEDVLRLAVAQDQITWFVMSVFVAADAVLLATAFTQLVYPGPALYFFGYTGLHLALILVGLAITGLSYLMLLRSHAYSVRYWDILRTVQLRGRTLARFPVDEGMDPPRAWRSIQALYVVLAAAWVYLLAAFVLVLQ